MISDFGIDFIIIGIINEYKGVFNIIPGFGINLIIFGIINKNKSVFNIILGFGIDNLNSGKPII